MARYDSVKQALSALVSINPYDRYEALEMLAREHHTPATERFIHMTYDAHWRVREAAVWGLGDLSAPAATHRLCQLVDDVQERMGVRHAALYSLGRIGDIDTLPRLFDIAHSPQYEGLHGSAARAIVAFGPHALGYLCDVLTSTHTQPRSARTAAAQLLGKLHLSDALGSLLYALDHDAPTVQWDVVRALGEMRDTRAVHPLSTHLQTAPYALARVIVWALHRMATPPAQAAIIAWLDDHPAASHMISANHHLPPDRPESL